MKFFPALAALCAIGIAVAGCSAGHTAGYVGRDTALTADSPIVLGLSTAPSSLDFTRNSGAAIPEALMGNVYEGLVRIDASGAVQPWLAESWDVDSTQKIYTFRLRHGVSFSNGAPFNADSAKFSLDRVRTDAWTNGNKSLMSPIADAEVLDDYTLRVTLSQASQRWLWALGLFPGAMMSPSGIDTLQTNPIGTGPYTVSNFAAGLSISLTPNENYWGPKPSNNGVTLRYFSDATGATNALQSGDIDAVYAMQAPELLDTLKARGIYSIDVGSTNGELLLSMNNRRAPFSDKRVRQAVMYGVDRQAVIDTAWYGYGIDTGGTPVAPTDPWYEKSTEYPFDPAKAKELMQEAGAVGTHITLAVPSRPYATAAAEILISQLRDIGFDVSIQSVEFPAVWLQQVFKSADYDMSLIVHAEPRDVTTIFGNPSYYIGYDNAAVRDEFAAADQADYPTMVAEMRKAVDMIMDDAAADNLFNFPNIVVRAPGITGINPSSPTGTLEAASIRREGGT
ncbi:MAG: ABC transporter substrate-binding protein [Corynebacterium sp.]|nr:ABC transporter substrate-binding protein [Corynebacterium sp.]